MTPITFFIPYHIQPKQADRSSVVNRPGAKPFVRHYQSPRVVKNAQALAVFCAPHRPAEPIDQPCRVTIETTYPWTSDHRKKHRALGRIPKGTKPDVDQLVKQILDVLEATGFFVNDSRVASLSVDKYYGDVPGTRVTVEVLE